MDWTMIANAEGTAMRLQTLYYLLKERYQLNAAMAAEQLLSESKVNPACSSLLNELKKEIGRPTIELGMGKVFGDADARSYFQEILSKFE